MSLEQIKKQIIGKPVEVAALLLEEANIKWRISSREGLPCVLTMDYNPERLNFHVTGGLVVAIYHG